jgi:hypothetical protein
MKKSSLCEHSSLEHIRDGIISLHTGIVNEYVVSKGTNVRTYERGST